MERSEAYGFSGAMSGAFLLSCLLFAAISRRQRGPYMDEVFHVPQAQAYCHGRFLQINVLAQFLPYTNTMMNVVNSDYPVQCLHNPVSLKETLKPLFNE
ncbi:hypothetical protein BTVI_139604 [Pitangus sulphuratus]|nr:hypothetical protein BTVI_139604 [Pitangus sulphuratus]